MNISKVLSYLGLAMKSGNLVSGEFMTENAVKEGKAQLVIVADDASANTKKMFTNMCTFYKVPMYCLGDKELLGHVIGKEFRASLAILDQGFAKSIQKQLELEENEEKR